MQLLGLISFLLIFTAMTCGQDAKKIIADGTLAAPLKHSLQPMVESLSVQEVEAVRNEALRNEISFEVLPQMSSEVSNYKKDFELLDVAEGFFIYREIEFRAYLYTAYSQKIRRNYQGIIVMCISENGTKFTPKAHYVYQYQGDNYIRPISDLNGNFLGEIAIFSDFQTKRGYRKTVRIIEFSPNGLLKFGVKEIYSSVPQKQRIPWNLDKSKPAKRVYTPPIVTATKIYAEFGLTKTPRFFAESGKLSDNKWTKAEKSNLTEIKLDEDLTDYVEILKPVFPKGIGEK